MTSSIHKTEGRIQHPDGTFSDYITVRFPAVKLKFRDINQRDSQVKLRDIAHFLHFKAHVRGEKDPMVVAFLLLEEDQPAQLLFQGISAVTAKGETLTSVNSLITYTMRQLFREGWVSYKEGSWQEQVPEALEPEKSRAAAILEFLQKENRLHLESGYGAHPPGVIDFALDPIDPEKNLAPIANCAAISDLVYNTRPRLAFNTTFFLLEYDDYAGHHSGLGEGFNLQISDGIIQRPPLYRRAALFGNTDSTWQAGFFDMNDIEITLPSGLDVFPHSENDGHVFTVNPDVPGDIAVYTRYYGVSAAGRVLGRTPTAPSRLELTIADRRVGGWKTGGGLDIPQNGFVLSFAEDALTDEERIALFNTLHNDIKVSYQFIQPEHNDIMEAIQAGPMLVKDGEQFVEGRDIETEEEFWYSRTLEDNTFQVGAVPTDFDGEIHNRHARVGLGIGADGEMVLVAVAGVSKGIGMSAQESQGASLVELAGLLRDAGATHAINLDGGGSAQVYYMGGRAIVTGERRGEPLVHYDRMVPSAGIVE